MPGLNPGPGYKGGDPARQAFAIKILAVLLFVAVFAIAVFGGLVYLAYLAGGLPAAAVSVVMLAAASATLLQSSVFLCEKSSEPQPPLNSSQVTGTV
jgi:hypothetical protein